MKLYAKIISDEPRFAKMLSLELAELGIETKQCELPGSEEQKLYIIADLDRTDSHELADYASLGILIGYSKQYEEWLQEKAGLCAAFLHRPFSMAEFRSLFEPGERPRPHKAYAGKKKQQYLTVETATRTATFGDQHFSLSDNEFKVLNLLCEHRGETVSREELQELLGADEGNMGDVYICHLRRKLDNKLGLKLIYTVRGKGYVLKL